MKIQTRGEFENYLACNAISRCFVFIKYKGRWIESIAEDHGDHVVYLNLSQDTAYLPDCITMVCKPEPPEDS